MLCLFIPDKGIEPSSPTLQALLPMKQNQQKKKGTWGELQKKPDTSFPEPSPSGATRLGAVTQQ